MTRSEFQIYFHLFNFLLGIFLILGYLNNPNSLKIKSDNRIALIYIITAVFYFTFRDLNNTVDTLAYHYFYFTRTTYLTNLSEYLQTNSKSVLFSTLAFYTNTWFGFRGFLFFFSTLNFGLFYSFLKKIQLKIPLIPISILLVFFCCLFSFTSLQGGLMLNSVAILLMLNGFVYLYDKKFRWALLFSVLAFLFHKTTVIGLFSFCIPYFFKKINIRTYLLLYMVSIALSFFSIGFTDFAIFNELINEGLNYSNDYKPEYYKTGFRLGFVLYNSIFVIYFLNYVDLNNNFLSLLVKYFLLSSSLFFFSFKMAFVDRIGLYSWLIIPILFLVSYTKFKQITNLNFLLYFSVFMIINLFIII